MTARKGFIGAALSVTLAGALGAPAAAHGTHAVTTFHQVNLVSDQPGVAAVTDPDLVNPWGVSHGPNTPIWVSDNGADVSTLYRTDTLGSPVTRVPLVVSVPGGAPTGQVFNDTSRFTVPGTGRPAMFVFAGEDGDLSAWNQAVTPLSSAVPVGHTADSVYKGLALVHTPAGPRLLAADFHRNRIDVFDGRFDRVRSRHAFRDRSLPAGYAPFNVAAIGRRVFVTYAQQDADRRDDVAGAGHGFVDVYSTRGHLLDRFASRGTLNSPWGMAIAPSSFGSFAGDLLVGNFGDGRIHAFDPRHGRLLGTLRDTDGRPLAIEGLWALLVGDQAAGGSDAVWFSAGPDDEHHGLLGVLRAAGHVRR